MAKFPCLRLAYEAVEAGGAKTVALNAADEVAVAEFLDNRIAFNDIPKLIEDILKETKPAPMESISSVLAVDAEARVVASEWVRTRVGSAVPIA